MRDHEYVSLAAWMALCLGGGLLIGSRTRSSIESWYKKLKKPSFTPPNWAFPVVWTTLYILMSISAWLVYQEGGFKHQSKPLFAFLTQLALNFMWTPLFFTYHMIEASIAVIVSLWLGILYTTYLFYPVSPLAAALLVPYQLWVSLATALNVSIWKLNPQQVKKNK